MEQPYLFALAIEDNHVARLVIGSVLDSLGIACAFAETLADGLDMMSHGNFDLVLLDLFLPDVTDPRLSVVAVQTKAGRVPVVVLSTTSDMKLIRDVLNLGVSGFLHKSHIDDLAVNLERVLKIHNLKERLDESIHSLITAKERHAEER